MNVGSLDMYWDGSYANDVPLFIEELLIHKQLKNARNNSQTTHRNDTMFREVA